MELPEGWHDPDDDGRTVIAERTVTLDDMIELFGEDGRGAWPAIKQVIAEGGTAALVVRGRPVCRPAARRAPLALGDLIHGYAQGVFGQDHYACARVEALGADWVVVRGVSTGQPAAAVGEDVIEAVVDARDNGRAAWCQDGEGCNEER